jgi:hypothetical protein
MFLGRSDSRSDRRVAGLSAAGIAGGMEYPLTERCGTALNVSK